MAEVILPDLPRCRVHAVAETVIDTWWCRQEIDPFWRLYCNRDGGAAILHQHGRLELAAGICYLVPAWTTFRGRCPGPLRHRFVHFQVAGLPEPWLRRAADRPLPVPGMAWDLDRLGDGPAGRLRLHARLCEAVATALAAAPPPPADPRAEAVVAPALRLIDADPARPPRVAALAAAAGVSPDHLARCFAAVVGRTPARWIQERRIAVAAERLAGGTATVAAVAAELGFANPYHFTRVFSRITGSPPGEWRRRMGDGRGIGPGEASPGSPRRSSERSTPRPVG